MKILKKKYITLIDGKFAKEEIKDNKEAQDFAKDVLENLAMTKFLLKHNRKEFIELFCEETGFPDLKTVRKNMESEITNAIHKLAKQNDFDVCFIGYDKNCSMGRTMALPGRDCDGLFMIIDTSKHKDKPWLAAATRWQFKDIVNQRILNTPAGSLPEVLSLDFIEDGLNLADYAYKKENFTKEDLARFSANIKDDSKDFVKCAEFNLRLVKHLKNDIETRDKFYKTSMFVELVRSGCILENNLPDKLMEKIKKSPLYQFSNLQRQEAFENIPKEKHLKRIEFLKDFDNLSTEKQFEIIKDMIYSSLHIRSAENEGLFVNINSKGEDEMGNILEMYDLLMNTPCID